MFFTFGHFTPDKVSGYDTKCYMQINRYMSVQDHTDTDIYGRWIHTKLGMNSTECK